MSFIIRYAYMICLRTFTPLKIVDPSYIATITLANVHRFSHFFSCYIQKSNAEEAGIYDTTSFKSAASLTYET